MSEFLILLKNINKNYYLGREHTISVLKNIDLEIKKGEFLSIMGPSGSGKSTLLYLLGLLEKADYGKYLLDGQEVDKLSEKKLSTLRRHYIGFVFQTFNLLPRLTAYKNIELPLAYAKVSSQEKKKRTEEALEVVNLTSRAKHRSNELSGGEAQRVAIARALVNKPKIILADEPTGNLDSHSGKEIMEVLKKLNSQGITVIVVTHDQQIANFGGKAVYLKDGEII